MCYDSWSCGTPKRERVRRRDSRFVQDEIRRKKEAEEIGLFRRKISYRSVRANRRKKGRLTKVVGDSLSKRSEIFISRTKVVGVLSFII